MPIRTSVEIINAGWDVFIKRNISRVTFTDLFIHLVYYILIYKLS